MGYRRINWSQQQSNRTDSAQGRFRVRREDSRYRRPPWWADRNLQMLLAIAATILFVRLVYVLATKSVS